jgi:hypothetical protein
MNKRPFLVSIKELENISFQAGQVQERILAISAIITDEELIESSTAKLVEKLRVLEEQRSVLNGKIIQLATIDNE